MSWISRLKRQLLPFLVIALCIVVFRADVIARRYRTNLLLTEVLPDLSDQPAVPDWPACPSSAGSERLVLHARHLVEQAPDDAQAWQALAQAQWLASQCSDSIVSWQRSLEYQVDPMAAYHLGLAYLATQEWELAVSSFRQANAGPGLATMALYALETGHPEAMRWLELSVDVQPQIEIVEQLTKRQSPKNAALTWQKVFEMTAADNPIHWWAQSEIAMSEGHVEEAVAALKRGESLTPDPAPFIKKQAQLLAESGDLAGAIDAYQRAFYLDPKRESWEAIHAGELYYEQGSFDQALRWFSLAKDAAPGWGDAEYHQGLALWQIGRSEEAMRAFHQAETAYRSRLERSNPVSEEISATYWLAQSIYQQMRVAEAIPWLERAITLSGNWIWNLQLGHWYRELDEFDKAIEAYRMVLQNDPSHSGALQALQELGALPNQ